MDIDLYDQPLGEDRHGEPVFLKDIWPTRPTWRRPARKRSSRTCSVRATARCSTATSAGTRSRCRPVSSSSGTRDRRTSAVLRSSTSCRASPCHRESSSGRAAGRARRHVTTDHISPAGSIKLDGPAARYLGERRRGDAGLQFLRLAPRQPRGHDARHVRQHPPAEPDGAPGTEGGVTIYLGKDQGERGSMRRPCSTRRPTPRCRDRGQGIRLGLVARLGGQGHEPAGDQGGVGGELRAHPPLEPRGDWRVALAVRRATSRGLAGVDGPRDFTIAGFAGADAFPGS